MELFLKAGDDGKVVGDCPFAHYCRLVAALRGLPIKATPLSPATKPKWHLDAYKGSLPCLVIGGDTSAAVLESSAIAEKLNGLPATDFQLGVVGAFEQPGALEHADVACDAKWGSQAVVRRAGCVQAPRFTHRARAA